MKEVVQLQAADVIAYELNKRAVNSVTGGRQFVRKSLDNLRLSHNSRKSISTAAHLSDRSIKLLRNQFRLTILSYYFT